MTDRRQLYRSRDALIAGVCAGVADYFGADPLAVRILAVALAVASAGSLAVAYLVLWAIIPKAPKAVKPVEVQPKEVHSETFGSLDYLRAQGEGKRGGRECMERCSASFGSMAHVPPPPPAALAAQVIANGTAPVSYSGPLAQPAAPGVGLDGGTVVAAGASDPAAPVPPTAPAASAPSAAPASPAPAVPPAAPIPRKAEDVAVPSATSVYALLSGGCLLLFAGLSAAMSSCVEGVRWWQCWPLLLVIIGIVRMSIPGRVGVRMLDFVLGLAVFCLGVVLLFASLGIISWGSLAVIGFALWPLFVLCTALIGVGALRKAPGLVLAAGLLFLACCIAGVAIFAEPGSLHELVVTAPYGREYRFPLHG